MKTPFTSKSQTTPQQDPTVEAFEATVLPTEPTQNTGDGSTQLTPLSATALQFYSPEEQQEILNLSQQIDVKDIEKVMSYGQIPLIRSFEQAGKILQAAAGSSADQEVIKEVIELSKEANQTYDDFNLVLKEPNPAVKLLRKIFYSVKSEHEKEVSIKAVSCYKLLESLSKACDMWITSLKENYSTINASIFQDVSDREELEKYIIAGRIAQERIHETVEEARKQYELSALPSAKQEYEELAQGEEAFEIVLLNLEKSRGAFVISTAQLALQEKSNRNIQIAVRTQKTNSTTLAAQQLRNAILNVRNNQALEGQKSLASLNSELLKKISEATVLTAEESEKILTSGVYDVAAALEAAKTVISGCDAIKKAGAERVTHIASQMETLKTLLNDMEPYVTKIKEQTTSSPASSQASSNTSGGLKF